MPTLYLSHRPQTGLLFKIIPLLFGSLFSVNAADFFWDANPALDGNQNGTGEWSSTAIPQNWTSTASLTGSVNLPWVNATDSIANLGATSGYSNAGTGGELTLGEDITLNQLIVGSQAGAYTLAPSINGYSLIFVGTTPTLQNDSSESLAIQAGWQAASGLTKLGTGKIIFTAAAGISTGSGTLAIQQGSVQLSAADTLPTNMAVILGDQNTAGSLAVDFDQTIASLSFQSRSSGVTNNVTIAEGATLTLNGSLIVGIVDGTSAGDTTLATIQGAGSLVVDNAAANFIVSSGNKASGSNDFSTLDLSDLSSFTANVDRFYVGRSTNATGSFGSSGRPQSTLYLSANNVITANTMVVGSNTQTTTSSFLYLGQQNVLNVDDIVVANGRSNGRLEFDSGLINPTLTLRGTAGGSSRANITLGDSRNITGVGSTGGSSQPNGIVDLTAGTVDLMIDTLTVASGGTDNGGYNGGAYGKGLGTFSFGGDDSIVDVNTLIIGRVANSTGVAANTADPFITTIGTVNMNGGTLIINTRFVLSLSDDGAAGNQQSSTGTFNLTSGTVVVGSSGSPVDVELGDHSSDGTGISTGILNLTGGSFSVNGNILRGSTGPTEGTVTLNGSQLNLNGGMIGDAILPVTLNLQSGTLTNIAEINGGGTVTKTGTGTLSLTGTNTFTGDTLVSAGKLLVTSTSAFQSSSSLTVEGAGTFEFVTGSGGSLTLAATSGTALTLNDGATLGMELGSSTGSLILNPAAIVSTQASAEININLYSISGQTPPASSTLISAPGGGLTSNGATYTLGTVYNATDYTISLQATDTSLLANTTSATALTNAYWLGNFSPDNTAWAASNGSTQGNWVTNSDGTGDTGLVPGASTNVFFSATGASLPSTTVLGADMQINSLTVTTATALNLSTAENRLTIHGNDAITVADGAGAVTLDTILELAGAAPIISVNNTGGLTLNSEISGSGGLTKIGTGTLTLGAIVNLYTGSTSILGGTLAISSETALGDTSEFVVDDYLLLNGGTLRALDSFAIANPKRGITLGSSGGTFAVDSGKDLEIANEIKGNGSLTKTGSGGLELSTASSYTGTTNINGGTLSLNAGNNTLPSTAIFNFGGSSTLDLNSNSQSVSALQFTTGSAASVINITGAGGSLTVNNASSDTNFTSTSQTQPLTVDMSGLSNYTLNGGTRVFRVGLTGGGHSANGTTEVVTVTLAQTNTITAGSLLMGDQVGSSGGGLSTLYLGQTNTLNVNTLNIASSRSSGLITFSSGLVNPTLKIRGNNGTAALTTWNMGDLNNFTNNVWATTADFSAGDLDALVTTLNVGRVGNRFGTLNANFIMGTGTLTVTNLNIGTAAGDNTGTPGTRIVNSNFTLEGSGTVNITNLKLAENTSAINTGNATANGTLTVKNGTVNVGAAGIKMGSATVAGYIANATLDLQGGTLSTSGNIFKSTTGAGTVTSTLILNGGTLNLNGNTIGTLALPINTVTLQKGELQNVSQINGGGDISKSGLSTDVLRMTGMHIYTGRTTIAGGSLLVNGTHTGGGSYSVQSTTTLGGSGSITLASGSSINIAANGNLSVGDGTVSGQTLQLTTTGVGQVSFTDSSSILTLDLFSDSGLGGTNHSADASSADILAITGEISLNGARLIIEDPNNLASSFSEGDTWKIFDWSGITSGDLGTGANTFTIDPLLDLPALSSGYFWNLDDLYIGGTIAIVVPEPSRAFLSLLALGTCFFRRRRSIGI